MKKPVYTSRADEYMKHHPERKASEWFMRTQDEFYLHQAKRYTYESIKEITKVMAALIAVSTAISIILSLVLHCKSKSLFYVHFLDHQ